MQTKTGSPEIVIPKANIVLDATVLSTVMGCARLTDFRFNHNLIQIGGKSNSLEVGSVVHKYLEKFYQTQIDGFSKQQGHIAGMTSANLYATGCKGCSNFVPTETVPKPECDHQPNEYPGMQTTPYEDEKPYQVGWKRALETCEQYYEFYKNDFWVPLEVEIVKGDVLYEDDNLRILWKAKLDLVVDTNNGIFPCDHKTMKQRRDTLSLNNQFMGQCLVQKTRSVIINKIGFQKTLKPEEKFTRAMVSYSAKRLIEWQGTILPYWAYRLLDYTENDYWPPNFDHCENKYGGCPFIEVCSVDPDERERELRQNFTVGTPWNPTNPDPEES